MRIVKEPEVRRNEILDSAERLFVSKGFEKATVSDILDDVKIAKGTFYYYFRSKDDVLDALVERRIAFLVEKAGEINSSSLPPGQKMLTMIFALKPRNEMQKDFNSVLHETDNAKMHQKALVRSIQCLGPCFAKVINEGISAGIFNTPYPAESAEILLSAALVLFDDDFFKWTKKEKSLKIAGFLSAMERILGAKPGNFSEFSKIFG